MAGEALVQSSNQSAATVKMSETIPLWHSAARVTVTATNDKNLQHVEKQMQHWGLCQCQHQQHSEWLQWQQQGKTNWITTIKPT